MRWHTDERKEAKHSPRGRSHRRSPARGGGRMTMEHGRGLHLKSAPSSLLTHSTFVNSFSSFYSRIPLLPPSLLSFLPSAYVSSSLLSIPTRYPGVTKPDESALNVLRLSTCRLTEMSNSNAFLLDVGTFLLSVYLYKNIACRKISFYYLMSKRIVCSCERNPKSQ